ncbi:MAG: peptide deformylase [Verrucomicrobia bacterium]|nr:peptide deformylase [Verrucomicrobiota bacterium]MBS0637173.1 peptide deformylase [Verrucomicrobiota bacterium]
MITILCTLMNIFVVPSEPRLSLPVEEVAIADIPSQEVQDVIDNMYEIARGERTDGEKKVMVGLAAPQIGVYRQIILVDVSFNETERKVGELVAFINPKITWKSDEKEEGHEGCYSVDGRLFGIVPRAASIKITAYDREGKSIEQELRGLSARIFQHECDHLEGIRFPDVVGEHGGKLHWIEEDQFPEYKKAPKEWPHIVSLERWQAMKSGRE